MTMLNGLVSSVPLEWNQNDDLDFNFEIEQVPKASDSFNTYQILVNKKFGLCSIQARNETIQSATVDYSDAYYDYIGTLNILEAKYGVFVRPDDSDSITLLDYNKSNYTDDSNVRRAVQVVELKVPDKSKVSLKSLYFYSKEYGGFKSLTVTYFSANYENCKKDPLDELSKKYEDKKAADEKASQTKHSSAVWLMRHLCRSVCSRATFSTVQEMHILCWRHQPFVQDNKV